MAATSIYTGPSGTTTTPTTGNFNSANNWSPSGVPPTSDPTLELDFNNSGSNSYTATNDLASPISLNKLVLNSTSTGSTTIDGSNAFNFVSNGATLPTLTQNGSGAVTLSAPLQLTDNLTVNGNGAGVLTLGGSISSSSSATFTKTGSSTLTLTGSNSYGATIVNQGTLNLNASSGVAIPGDLTLVPVTATNGAVLVKLLASNQIAATSNVSIQTASGVANGNNQLDLNGFDNTIASLTFVPITSGQTMQVTTGAGTLTLNGDISINGNNSNPISINGKLSLGGATRTIGGANTNSSKPVLSINAAVSNGGLTQVYTGTVVLSGANTYTGQTTLSTGTLSVNTLGNDGEIASSLGAETGANRTINIGGLIGGNGTSGTLTYTGGTTSTDHPIFLHASDAGKSTLNQNGSGTLTWTGGITGAHSFTLSGTGVGVFSGAIQTTGGSIHKAGAGTWSITSGSNSYPNLNIDQGILSVATVNNASTNGVLGNSSGAVTVSTSTSAGTFQYTGVSAAPTRNFSLSGNAANPSTFEITSASTILSLATVSGSGSLVKIGAGGLTITSNSYAGNTSVNAGTLTISQPNLGDTSTVSIASGGVLNLNYSSSSVTDSIDTLVLNGIVQQPGTYNAGNAGPFITGTGNLLVTAPEPTSLGLAGLAAAGLLTRRRRVS